MPKKKKKKENPELSKSHYHLRLRIASVPQVHTHKQANKQLFRLNVDKTRIGRVHLSSILPPSGLSNRYSPIMVEFANHVGAPGTSSSHPSPPVEQVPPPLFPLKDFFFLFFNLDFFFGAAKMGRHFFHSVLLVKLVLVQSRKNFSLPSIQSLFAYECEKTSQGGHSRTCPGHRFRLRPFFSATIPSFTS